MKRLLPLLLLLACAPAFAQESSTNARRVTVLVSNASPTGTTLYRLAKLTGAPSKATVAATTDTDGIVGVVVDGAGTTGTAIVQTAGQVGEAGSGGGCAFDGGTTAGNYVQASSTAAGKCHDAGSSYPTSGQIIGRVLSTNAGAGTYPILLTPGVKPSPPTSPGGSSGDLQYNNAGAFAGSLLSQSGGNIAQSSGSFTAPKFIVSGTGGAGVVELLQQSSNPAGPSTGYRLFADTSNRLSFSSSNDNFTRSFGGALTANRIYTLPDAAGTFVLDTATQTLTNKTLTTPTIGSFVNATHSHQTAAGGGTLDASAIAAGQLAPARGGLGVDASGCSGAFLWTAGSAACTSTSGTSSFARTTSPAFVTPSLGAATATSINGATVPSVSDTLVGKATTDTLTNKTYDAEGTGNVLTTPEKVWLPAAGCVNATASSFWDLPVSTPAVAACVTGTNTQKGVLQFADTSGGFSSQNAFLLPADFTGTVDARIIWRTSATSGNAKFSLSTICTAVDATETDDPAFNTASTATTAAPGTTLRLQSSAITGLTVTGCAAGEFLHLKLFRDGNDAADTLSASLDVLGVEVTYRRAQ